MPEKSEKFLKRNDNGKMKLTVCCSTKEKMVKEKERMFFYCCNTVLFFCFLLFTFDGHTDTR